MSMTWCHWSRTSPWASMPLGQLTGQRVAGAAVMGGHLLGVLEGGVHGVGPTNREVVEGRGAADFIESGQDVFQHLRNAVEGHQLVEGAVQAAFGASAVVTRNVDEEGVFIFTHVLKRFDDAHHLHVGMLGKAGVGLHEAR